MQDLKTTTTFGSQYGFKPISEVMKEIPDADRPPALRRWNFWKLNRADTIMLVYAEIFGEQKLVTFGDDALKLSALIGMPIENYAMGDAIVPGITLERSQMADLAAYCKLYRTAIEFVI